MRALALAAPLAAACTSPVALGGADLPLISVSVHVDRFDDQSRPAAGVPVYLTDLDGSLAARLVTDAAGNANGKVEDGGTATASWAPASGPSMLVSQAGLRDHDVIDLTYVDPFYSATRGTMAFELPVINGTWNDDVWDGCEHGAGRPTPALTVSACAGEPLHVYVATTDPSRGVAFLGEMSDVAFRAGNVVTVPGLDPAPTFTAHFDHVAPSAARLDLARGAIAHAFANPVSVWTPTPTVDVTFGIVPTGYDRMSFSTTVVRGDLSAAAVRVIDPIRASDTSYTLDFATVGADGRPTEVADGETFSVWMPETFPRAFVEATSSTRGTDGPPNWILLAPPDTTSFAIPQLPIEASANLPSAAPEVAWVQIAGFSDYDAHKATLARDLLRLTDGSSGRVTTVFTYGVTTP